MKNKLKKIFLFMLAGALAAGMLSGCAKGGKDKTDEGKGRYIEKDMELPLKEGERILNLSQYKDTDMLLFSCTDSEVNRYEYKNGKWEGKSVEWVSEMYKDQPINALDMEETADGTQVLLTMDMENQSHLVRSTDGKAAEMLDVPYLTQQTEYGYPAITDLLVDGEGNYWIRDVYQSKVVTIASDTLETILETETFQNFNMSQKVMAKGADGSIAVNTEEGLYTLYNGKEPASNGTLKYLEGSSAVLCSNNGQWYGSSSDGISRLQENGEITEILMDGTMGAMGSPLNVPIQIVRGENEEFYVLYMQEKTGTNSLKQYVYDKTISAVPEHTLTVFGLAENDTVRQAITNFQKKNTDVKVEFNTSGKEEGAITSDDIRTLNTELLGGNGADVLLLDGLPTDSYIEKGILEDLTETAKNLTKNESYLQDVLEKSAQKDGKLYGLPIKFSAPIIYGDTDVQEALKSIDTLSAYLDSNPEATIFGISDSRYIQNLLFQLYQNELIETDGKINQEKLAHLLELESKIAENAQAESYDETKYETNAKDSLSMVGVFNNVVGAGILKYPNAVATDEINSVSSMMIPYAIMRQLGVTPASIQNMYKPIGVVSVNKNSKQKELAKEFLTYLFSNEIQSAQIDDGLPVLKSALDSKIEEVNTDYAQNFMMSSSLNIGDDIIEITAEFPVAEEVQSLIDLCGTLSEPVEQDRIIWNIYRETAGKYLEGSLDASKAAETIAQKVDTYLAE